jgi:hypothetical protein
VPPMSRRDSPPPPPAQQRLPPFPRVHRRIVPLHVVASCTRVHPVLFLGLLGVIGCNFAAVGGQAQAVSLICEVDWHLVLFDEAHKLKDKKSKLVQAARQLSCPVKFGLTGTPIQNCHQEIYTLLDLLTPNCCGQWSEFDEYRLRHIGTRAGILS